MNNRFFRTKAVLISVLTLILAAGTAHAAKNLISVQAEVEGERVQRGGAVFTECVFANASHMDTVESTITAFVRFADGSKVVVFDETQVLAPGDAAIRRAALVVAEDASLGTAVWECHAQSIIVGGPRPVGQGGADSDSATFEVFDILQM